MSRTPNISAPSSSTPSLDNSPSILSEPPTDADAAAAAHPSPVSTEYSRLQRWTTIVMSRVNRMIMILTYPFMVILTIASLLIVIIFCIFPTLICMTFGVCIYYCLMEDPIPLPVLLRYLLSPDPDDNNSPNPYPYSQNRGAIQAKLIIRKVLRIETIEHTDDEKKDDGVEDEEQPRRHPFPIEFRTNTKCFYFSEPIVYEEKDEKSSRETVKDADAHVPFYQRTETSNIVSIPSGQENNLATLSTELASPPDDLELGLVEIAIGAADSEETTPTAAEESPTVLSTTYVAQPLQIQDRSEDSDSTESDAGNSSGRKDGDSCLHDNHSKRCVNYHRSREAKDESLDAKPAGATSDAPEGMAAAATEKLEEVMELVEDYFGIADARQLGATCDICLLDYEVDEEVAWSPNLDCVHTFHKECILDWLMRKPSCPSCRKDYLDGKNDNNV